MLERVALVVAAVVALLAAAPATSALAQQAEPAPLLAPPAEQGGGNGKAAPPPPLAPVQQPVQEPAQPGAGGVDVVTGAGKPGPPPSPRRKEHGASLAARLEWRWPEFGLPQLGLTLGQGALAIGSQIIPGMDNFQGINSFDEAGRHALRITDFDDALVARDMSDVGLIVLLNQRLIDTLFVTWWFHDKGSTALQMGLIDGQTITFSAGLNSLVAALAGRRRPYNRTLCHDPEFAETNDCTGSNRYRSFFSGHSTAAFTLAALTCVHHIELPLYGGGPQEAIPCVGTMLTASAVALLRVASDQHYLSDVLVGAAFGTASGFAVPYLFHYMHDQKAPNATLKALGFSSMSIGPSLGGVQMAGAF